MKCRQMLLTLAVSPAPALYLGSPIPLRLLSGCFSILLKLLPSPSALAASQPGGARRQPRPAPREDDSTSHLIRFSASPLFGSRTASASPAKATREGV